MLIGGVLGTFLKESFSYLFIKLGEKFSLEVNLRWNWLVNIIWPYLVKSYVRHGKSLKILLTRLKVVRILSDSNLKQEEENNGGEVWSYMT